MRFRSIAIALALTAAAAAAHAQDPALDRVQNLINTGRLTDARSTLAQWERAHGDPTSDATTADRARAIYLSGVLSTDPEAAENAFINVVLSYPSSEVAPDALLRLGQALYTTGDNERAVEYLSRLQSDYPPSTARETGILWLARAQLAHGAASDACGTTRDNLAATSNPNLRMLIEIERDRACAASGGAATRSGAVATAHRARNEMPAAPPSGAAPHDRRATDSAAVGAAAAAQASPYRRAVSDTPPNARSPLASLPDMGVAVDGNVREPARPDAERPRPPGAQPAPDARTPLGTDTLRNGGQGAASTDPPARGRASAAADANVGEFAVQTAAFTQLASAQRIAAEMDARGFAARIVTVPGSGLFRVRYGAFATSRDAAAAALHIRDAGFATLVVSDVRLEQRQ